MDPDPITTDTIRPGRAVMLPNGNRAVVQLQSGRSSLVRVDNAAAWYPTADLTVAPS